MRALVSQEIRRVEQVDVQSVAFDPFTAIQKPPQSAYVGRHLYAQRDLQRVHRAHLISHGTNAAYPSGNIGHIFQRAAAQERLEQTRRLIDVELHVVDLAVAQPDVQRPLALDAGHCLHADGANVTHAGGSI